MNAALSQTCPISDEIVQIRSLIAENTNEHGLYLTVERSRLLRDRLEVISRALVNLERELAVHRIGEQDRAAAGVLDDLAGEFLTNEASKLDASVDNLLFPDFKKGGKS